MLLRVQSKVVIGPMYVLCVSPRLLQTSTCINPGMSEEAAGELLLCWLRLARGFSGLGAGRKQEGWNGLPVALN